MDNSPARVGEQLCLLVLGYMIGTTSRSWDVPTHLIPVYIVIGGLILAARWAVVRARNRRDAERAARLP